MKKRNGDSLRKTYDYVCSLSLPEDNSRFTKTINSLKCKFSLFSVLVTRDELLEQRIVLRNLREKIQTNEADAHFPQYVKVQADKILGKIIHLINVELTVNKNYNQDPEFRQYLPPVMPLPGFNK